MPELHLIDPEFPYSACGPFTKHRELIKKCRETGSFKRLCRNELNKTYFGHNPEYSDSKDLGKITISDKILKDKPY